MPSWLLIFWQFRIKLNQIQTVELYSFLVFVKTGPYHSQYLPREKKKLKQDGHINDKLQRHYEDNSLQ